MSKNKILKKLVIFSIGTILCLSSVNAVIGSLNEDYTTAFPELIPVMQKTLRENDGSTNSGTGSMAISDAGTWLMSQQDVDGWFPWTPGGGATRNTQGPSGRGLLYAYEVTGDSLLLDAAVDCGDYMIDVLYQGLGPNPSVYTDGDPRFATHDPLFLEELSQYTADSSYADFVQTYFWDKLTSATYGETNDMDAGEFGDYVVNARNSQGIVALSPWDISATAVGAYIAGETAIANEIMDSILYGLNLTTSGDYYDSIGLAGAIWASVVTGVNLDPDTGAYVADDSTSDLANTLVTMRTTASPKGWLWCSAADPTDYTNGDTQTTAFALAALAALDYNTYLSEICEGINFIKNLQQVDGQYLIYPSASPTESGSVETHAEAIFGMTSSGRVTNIDTNEVFCTIQAGIDDTDTLNGHTLSIEPGIYIENAASYCDINLNKDVSLIGAGSGSTIVELTQGKSEGLQIVSGNPTDITIEGITFTHQTGSTNAAKRALRVFSALNSLTLIDVEVKYAEINNVELNGDITTLTIDDCNFHHAGYNGLMCPADIGSGSITDSNFDYNGRLDVWSSGMHLFGLISDLDIIGCSMSYNTDSGFNGRQLNNIYFEDITASYNTHANGGGGICISEKVGSSSDITMVDITAEHNGRDGILVWTWYDYCSISDVTITGGLFTNNGWAGIRVLNWPASGSTGGTVDNVEITEAQIMNNPYTGVWFELDYGSSSAISSYVNYNNILGNTNYGVLNSGDGLLDATCNWWGDISGPNHGGFGSGTGDSVSANVKYCPWLTDEYPYGTCNGGFVCRNKNDNIEFCSIQKAIDADTTSDGETIEAYAGIHPGNIIVYKEVTIESKDGAASTIIDANFVDYSIYENSYGHGINYNWAETNDPGLLKNGFMIWSDYVTIDGFTIINASWPSQYNRGIGILIGSIHTTYAGFIPWNIDQWGGIIPNPDEPTPTGVVIKNNIIDGASDGIYNWASNGNTFEYNTVKNSVALGGVGIQCYEGGTNNIIRYNTVDNVDGSGISICGAWPDLLLDVSNTQIYENIVINNNWGVQYYNMYGSNVHAYNNNILNNNRGVVVEGVGGALVGHANYNNIVGNTEGIVNTAPDGVFDAECNWYGDLFGPMHPSNPFGGTGDTVSDNVDFIPWLNLPFEDPNTICAMGMCQNIVYVDDDYTSSTPGWYVDHFPTIQIALDLLGPYGTAIIYDGEYDVDLVIDNTPCDNTGITIMGEYGCFPTSQSAVIQGHAIISVNDVTIKYLEFKPTTMGAITVEDSITGTMLECNKFRRDCIADAIGVQALGSTVVDAECNWWGAMDGPNGGIMDDGKTADGNGVKNIGQVMVEPWIGIHAEIFKPSGTIEVNLGTPVDFDASGSFAYSFGDCCELTEIPMQYLWDFSDGTYSADMVTSHVFDQTGTYHVTLMVDSAGIPGLYSNFMYDWAYVTVHVVTEQTALTVNADGGNLGGYKTMVDEPLQFYGDAFGGKAEYNWYWNFGDQTADSTEQNPLHTYTQPGVYTAKLTVISGSETAYDTVEVIVHDIDELFVNINDANTMIGVETMFAASIHGGTPPYSVEWDFGDGTISEETSPTHIYSNPGEYTVTVTVTDDKDKTAIDTAVLTVEKESTVETSEIKDVQGGLGIQATIDAGDNSCSWMITVDGMVFFGGQNSGSIDANTQETVKLGFSIALGNVDIMVKAGGLQKSYKAFALGPLYLNLQEV